MSLITLTIVGPLIMACVCIITHFNSKTKKLEGFDTKDEQGVIVHFYYGKTDLNPFYELESKFEKAIQESETGIFDGHEVDVDGSYGDFYMYGPSADKLLEVVKPIIDSASDMSEVTAKLRYGSIYDDNAIVKEIAIK